MTGYIFKKILQLIITLFVISILVFVLVHLAPGDPVKNMLGMNVSEETINAERERLGLDKPLVVQYTNFVKNLTHGYLGKSIYSQRPVEEEILQKYTVTFQLALGGVLMATVIGIISGIISATNHNKAIDNIIITLALVAVSTPLFFLSIMGIYLFSVKLGLLPSFGITTSLHYILPITILGLYSAGEISRLTRSSMLDVLSQDYIRTSKAKGIPNRIIIYFHALKNAVIPVITSIGLRFGILLAGSALVETVFSIPGMGRYLVDGVLNRDYPVVQGAVLVLAATFVTVNTITDLIYAIVDPRIKY
jgi:ABC-type dipeptide/oligopeptide/nickel transport system permease component